jgi:cytochrome c peroxidase
MLILSHQMLNELAHTVRNDVHWGLLMSHDSWMSCNSCHSMGHTNGMLNDNFSDGTFGTPKRVLSLLGRAGTAPFAWDGTVRKLEDQIRNSVSKTMQRSEPPTEDQVAAIAAFLRQLPPPPSLDELRGCSDPHAIARGRELFLRLECAACHTPPAYTSPERYDVGTLHQSTFGDSAYAEADRAAYEASLGGGSTDNGPYGSAAKSERVVSAGSSAGKQRTGEFNPPSLRGVGQRGPYFHDGSVDTLTELFAERKHQLPRDLDHAELADLQAFLRSL